MSQQGASTARDGQEPTGSRGPYDAATRSIRPAGNRRRGGPMIHLVEEAAA